jgi:hypothetical protein
MVTACLYRFLGGVEGSRLAVASFKAGGWSRQSDTATPSDNSAIQAEEDLGFRLYADGHLSSPNGAVFIFENGGPIRDAPLPRKRKPPARRTGRGASKLRQGWSPALSISAVS